MPPTTDKTRLLFTLLFSVLLHVGLLLTVSFDILSPPTNEPLNELEITLVRQQTPTPEEADFLAQADNQGGGTEETPDPEPAPTLPVPELDATESRPQLNTEPLPMPELPVPVTPQPTPEPEPKPEQEPAPDPEPEPEPEPTPEPEPEPASDADKLTTEEADEEIPAETTDADAVIPAMPETPSRPSAESLMAQARNEISALQDEMHQNSRAMSNTPEKRRISASTREYTAAAYMQAWERKVERIGNLNYPNEARQKGINGTLMVSVDIRPDGSVPEGGIVISRSSGHAVLDEAAKKIVRMGAPYAPVSEDVLQGSEMLTVIRTWKFESDRGLSTR